MERSEGVYGWSLDHWYYSLPVLVFIFLVIRAVHAELKQEAQARKDRKAALRHTLTELAAMTPREFELACRDLMCRDGLRVEHVGGCYDRAVDVIGHDQQGRTIVVQCKHTQNRATVGVNVLYAVNGTARPVHGADVVIVVTNGGFTTKARSWAPSHDIDLIDREAMTRWAEEGHTLLRIIGKANDT